MAKMGRPRVEKEYYRKVLSIRMSDEEIGKTRKYAEEHNMTVTQTIIKAVMTMIEQEAKG